MLRDLGRVDVQPARKGEIDPEDSVFVVLLWFDVEERHHFEIASIFVGKGEAEAAATRYANEGSRVLGHEFDYATVVEYQVGQLTPKAERHGQTYPRVSVAAPQDEASQVRALMDEVNRLNGILGQSQTTRTF